MFGFNNAQYLKVSLTVLKELLDGVWWSLVGNLDLAEASAEDFYLGQNLEVVRQLLVVFDRNPPLFAPWIQQCSTLNVS